MTDDNSAAPRPWTPPQPSPEPPAVTVAKVAGALLAVGAAVLNGLFDFAMIFATDSCGSTGGPGGHSPVCNGVGWLVLNAVPWLGLGLGVLGGVWLGVNRLRRGSAPWAGLALGILVYAASVAGTLLAIYRL